MNKFAEWFNKNRKNIGYTVGALNMLASINYVAQGELNYALIYFTLGVVLIFDSYEIKN